jgi:flagellar hook assembly protein FlgD
MLACANSSPLSPNSGEIIKANGLKMTASANGQGTGGLTFLIDLKNKGSATVSLQFSTSQAFDIAVSNSRGDVVWTWSHNKAFLQVFWQLDLKAGDVYSRQANWDLKASNGSQVPPGNYRVEVWITNASPNLNLSVEFSITI